MYFKLWRNRNKNRLYKIIWYLINRPDYMLCAYDRWAYKPTAMYNHKLSYDTSKYQYDKEYWYFVDSYQEN